MNRKYLTAAVLTLMAWGMALVVTLYSINAHAYPACMSGSWYNPDRIGEGVSLEVVSPDLTVGYFYTFAYNNENKWYTMIFEGNRLGNVYTSAGGRDSVRWVGTAALDLLEENTIELFIDQQFDFRQSGTIPWCIACQYQLLYTRLTSVIPCE